MPSLAELELELADAEAVQRQLQKLLDETEGWDELDAEEEEFVSAPIKAFADDQPRDENGRWVAEAASSQNRPSRSNGGRSDSGPRLLAAWEPRMLLAYDENQPRNPDGTFGSGGGQSEPDAQYDSAAIRELVLEKVKNALPEIAKLPEKEMLEELHKLTGAPNSWKTRVLSTYNGVRVTTWDPIGGGSAARDIFREGDKTVCKNLSFTIPPALQGKGFGTEMFARQVDALAAQGVAEIRTIAASGPGMNGYYTWARLGYDAPLNPIVRARVGIFKMWTVNTVQKLLAIPGGKEIWKSWGSTTSMTFDLSPGSVSRQALARNLAEKGIRAMSPGSSNAEMYDFDAAGPDLSEVDGPALDKFWEEDMAKRFAAEAAAERDENPPSA